MNTPVAFEIQSADGKMLGFTCPGCKQWHAVPVAGPRAWSFNGSFERPTLSPSLLVTGTEMPTDEDVEAWNKDRTPWPRREFRCHSFVTDGQILFLGDCSHALAGKTVPLSPAEK